MDNTFREYTKAELLALTPAKYLAQGWVDKAGKARPGLQTAYATAAAAQLFAAKLSPQELGFAYEALRLVLPLHSSQPAQKFKNVLEEALETVRGMIRQPNNKGLTKWLNECRDSVKTTADIGTFLAHMQAVLRQYSVMAASPPS